MYVIHDLFDTCLIEYEKGNKLIKSIRLFKILLFPLERQQLKTNGGTDVVAKNAKTLRGSVKS